MFIGLLLVNEEDDILADTLAANAPLVDCFYVLDGTADNLHSRWVCESYLKCVGYWRDQDVPYDGPPRDGWRQFLYQHAVENHGHDNWFLLLHGDEVWTEHPADIAGRHPGCDGLGFRLPFFVPREQDGWDPGRTPTDQLRWMLGPGWPEFRMFRGSPNVAFDPSQHFNVTPAGLNAIAFTPYKILHYPYRSPEQQARRAQVTWDPDNYTQTGLWSDERIESMRSHEHFRELTCA